MSSLQDKLPLTNLSQLSDPSHPPNSIWFSDIVSGVAEIWHLTQLPRTHQTQNYFFPEHLSPYKFQSLKKKCLKKINAVTTSYYHNECIQKLYYFSLVILLQREETKGFFIILRVLYASARFSGKWLSIFMRATEQSWVWVWLLAGPSSPPPTGVWIWWKSQGSMKLQPANFNL